MWTPLKQFSKKILLRVKAFSFFRKRAILGNRKSKCYGMVELSVKKEEVLLTFKMWKLNNDTEIIPYYLIFQKFKLN